MVQKHSSGSNIIHLSEKLGEQIRRLWLGYFNKSGDNVFYHIANYISCDKDNVNLWSRFEEISKTALQTFNNGVDKNHFLELISFLEMLEDSFIKLEKYVTAESNFFNLKILEVFLKFYTTNEPFKLMFDEKDLDIDLEKLVDSVVSGKKLKKTDLSSMLTIAEIIGHMLSLPISGILKDAKKIQIK